MSIFSNFFLFDLREITFNPSSLICEIIWSIRLICLGIIIVMIFFIFFFISKFSSLSSLIATLSIPIFIFFFNNQGNIIFFLIMFVLIFYTHRENIKRLKNKEETKTKIY